MLRNGALCGMTIDQIAEATGDNIYIAENQWSPRTRGGNPGLASGLVAVSIITRALTAPGPAGSVNYLTIEGQIPHCSKQFEAIEMGERGGQ